MDKIPFVKVDDMIIVEEDVWGELLTCYIKANPDIKGDISYKDEAIMEKVSLLLSSCEGSC